jgi:hypothetical protein
MRTFFPTDTLEFTRCKAERTWCVTWIVIWLVGICVFTLLMRRLCAWLGNTSLVRRLRGRRGNTPPCCPVHKRQMSLCVNALRDNEFECPVPECARHAHVFPDGHARIYEA